MSSLPEIPGFHLERLLGAGAQGQVFLAREEEGLQREVALKVFHDDPEGYRRELAMLRQVEEIRVRERAPGLVQSLSTGEVEGPPRLAFVAFEYLDAGTLQDWVEDKGPMSFVDAVSCACQVAAGLDALHRNGVFHRDVKPSNVLVDGEGWVRLVDFGLSRSLDGTLSAAGSPAFAAPELIAGRPTDGRAIDIYSLGATLAYLLTGETMLPGRPDVFLFERHGVPRPLQRVLVRAMASDPGARFATVPELVAGLRGDPEPERPGKSTSAEESSSESTEPTELSELGSSLSPAGLVLRKRSWDLVEKTGYAAAAASSLPIPGSEWVAMAPLHVAMVVGLGELHGVALARQAAARLVSQLGGTVGLSYLGSRLAHTAAKLLVPGVGALVGAPFVYASTLALGGVAIAYFEREGELSPDEIRNLFRVQLTRGRTEFEPTRASSPPRLLDLESIADVPGSLEDRLAHASALQSVGLVDEAQYRELKRLILKDL